MSAKRSKRSVQAYRIGVGLVLLFIFAVAILYLIAPSLTKMTYQGAEAETATAGTAASAIAGASTTPVRIATHVPTPDPVRGIYMTSCVASDKPLREKLVKLIDDTELNAVTVDIKSFDGHISFMPKADNLKFATEGNSCFVSDMQDFVDELHAHHIYVIGRVASFQDQLMVKLRPDLAVKKETSTSTVWRDYKGIAWIDTGSHEQWQYLTRIAEEAHAIGFDEINFDYIRFPADGNMKDIWYPISEGKEKSQVVRGFYEYLHDTLSPQGITISGDLFGMTTTNNDDLGIGQIFEYGLENFDYVMPMTYPSHYPNGFFGIPDPNKDVYDVVKISMDNAVRRALATTTPEFMPAPDARIGTSTPAMYTKPVWSVKKIRPWLQDNNYPVPYTPQMVDAQIRAVYDDGLRSWSLWNAGNTYTRSALKDASAPEAATPNATTTAL